MLLLGMMNLARSHNFTMKYNIKVNSICIDIIILHNST